MTDDLHARFVAWLSAPATADPPRDLALHASVCADCAARVAAFDLLTMIETGRAPLPPSRLADRPRPLVVRAARVVGAAAGVAVVATVAGIGIGSALQLRIGPSGLGSEPPAQQVLGGTGGPSTSATSTPTGTGTASPTTP